MKHLIVSLMLSLIVLPGIGQLKYERENRINKRDVPEHAVRFVDSLRFTSKIKWFQETGIDRTSFEAKTRFRGKRYSIEFSEDGTLEDIEIQIKQKEIPIDSYQAIHEYFSDTYGKFSFEKIQIQYSGDPALIALFFQNGEMKDEIEVHYEIVISTRFEGMFLMFEYLFTQEGEFVKKAQITMKPTDNLEF
jgi:hypothetical protein